jgi:pyrroline-5-carboxylate reductase
MEKNIIVDIRKQELTSSSDKYTIGIIGLGNMGGATVRALVEEGGIDRDHLFVSNRTSEDTYGKLAAQSIDSTSLTILENNEQVVRQSDVIILAIKPQQLRGELCSWKEKKLLRPDQLVVSFVAGVQTDTMKHYLGNRKQPIARAMPNALVEIGRGFTGWFISEDATVAQENYLRKVIDALGSNRQVFEEDEINGVTAFTGSGPAYVCSFGEELASGAMEIQNVSKAEAEEMAVDLILGTMMLVKKTGWSFAELRQRITSKNGTTEAALRVFAENNLAGIVHAGMNAALIRAREIGQEFDAKS